MDVRTESPRVPTSATAWADPIIERPAPAPRRDIAPLLLWCACLATATTLLLWLGAGRLATPPITDPGAWWAWTRTGDPAVVTMAGLRVLALGVAWYLTGVTAISVVARLLHAARLVRLADALSFGPIRVIAQQALGAGLATGVLVAAVPSGPAVTPAQVTVSDEITVSDDVAGGQVDVAPARTDATARPDELTPDATTPVGTAAVSTAPAPVPAPVPAPGTPTGTPSAGASPTALPTAEPSPATSPGRGSGGTASSPSEDRPQPLEPARTAGGGERVIAAGDNFWSIAEVEVGAHLGRAATEAEVHEHWERLVAANADRLVARGNPDLLLPGQRIVLPAVRA